MEDAAPHFEQAAALALDLLRQRESVHATDLHAALTRLKAGLCALILDRGPCEQERVRAIKRLWHREYHLGMRQLVRRFVDTHAPAVALLGALDLPRGWGQEVRNRLLVQRLEVARGLERLGDGVLGEVVGDLVTVWRRERGLFWLAGRIHRLVESLAVEGRNRLLDGRMIYFRTILSQVGQSARRTHFLFAGAVGEETRPFCAVRAGWVFDLGEVLSWEKMSWSGQREDGRVLECCGGRGCRHILLPVAAEGLGRERFFSRLGRRVVGQGGSRRGTRYWDGGTGCGQWHDAAFGNALEYMRRAVGRVGEPAGGIRNTPGERRMMFVLQDGVPWIEMGVVPYRESLLRLEKLIWRHEFGHYMDYFLNGFNNQPCSHADSILRRALIREGCAVAMRAGLRGSVAYRKRIAKRTSQTLHTLMVRMGLIPGEARRAWFDEAFRRFGLTLQQVEGVLGVDTLYGGFEREQNRLVLLLTALERRDVLLLGEQVLEWRRQRHQELGMALTVGDFFGSMTGNLVGRGHRDDYYRHHPSRRFTETFANGVVMLGDWNLFWTRLMQIMTPRFAGRMIAILQDESRFSGLRQGRQPFPLR
ncbi:MAG: hypothetical protein HQM02_03280 [Magnetococcales bacterium]|nr:hypothetical protein [Magnetococcales bacterium]